MSLTHTHTWHSKHTTPLAPTQSPLHRSDLRHLLYCNARGGRPPRKWVNVAALRSPSPPSRRSSAGRDRVRLWPDEGDVCQPDGKKRLLDRFTLLSVSSRARKKVLPLSLSVSLAPARSLARSRNLASRSRRRRRRRHGHTFSTDSVRVMAHEERDGATRPQRNWLRGGRGCLDAHRLLIRSRLRGPCR